jgi:hypothetical protein
MKTWEVKAGCRKLLVPAEGRVQAKDAATEYIQLHKLRPVRYADISARRVPHLDGLIGRITPR